MVLVTYAGGMTAIVDARRLYLLMLVVAVLAAACGEGGGEGIPGY